MWADIVRQLVVEVDYDNFKSAVSGRDPVYKSCLGKVWGVLLRLSGSKLQP
jgi:hypothetical protein